MKRDIWDWGMRQRKRENNRDTELLSSRPERVNNGSRVKIKRDNFSCDLNNSKRWDSQQVSRGKSGESSSCDP